MMLVANLLLALLWASLIGPFSPANFLVGFVLGFAVLALASRGGTRSNYIRRSLAAISLLLYTLRELVIANLKVARWTVSRLDHLRPAVLAVPLEECMTDLEITLLANLVTLTPGTLSLDVSDDRRRLFVHLMHVDDPDREIDAIKLGFERRILRVTRDNAPQHGAATP
jgi:multicomponent Na+:H+ antiporter subunit E